ERIRERLSCLRCVSRIRRPIIRIGYFDGLQSFEFAEAAFRVRRPRWRCRQQRSPRGGPQRPGILVMANAWVPLRDLDRELTRRESRPVGPRQGTQMHAEGLVRRVPEIEVLGKLAERP